ncbi:DeoR/GlpR family DNA-binding transcription regulator [Schumannella luteola]
MSTPLPANRRSRLLEILERDGAIRLEPAAAELDVSVMTVRRDIQDMDAEGLLRRVRGGAIAAVLPRAFGERAATRSAAKAAIARKAAALLPVEGAAAFDASTTSGALISLLTAQHLVVATNSIDNAAVARRRPGVRSIVVGGEFEERTGSLVGPTAELVAGSMSYSRFFTSASAVHPEFGMSEVTLDEASVKATFASRADETVLLADASKLGQQVLARALDWSAIDVLVTELDPRDDRLDPYRDLVEIL